MARRAPEKPLLHVASRAWLSATRLGTTLVAVGLSGLVGASCYSTGDGSPPPLRSLYYPVGLQVSAGGTVLYAVLRAIDNLKLLFTPFLPFSSQTLTRTIRSVLTEKANQAR